jgi:hypothetical protein
MANGQKRNSRKISAVQDVGTSSQSEPVPNGNGPAKAYRHKDEKRRNIPPAAIAAEGRISSGGSTRLADPAYQARKAANRLASRERRKARRRHKVSLESVTVVRRKGGREVVVRTGMTGSTSTGDGDKSV